MDGYRNDRQVEVVEHDIDMLVDASLKAKVQTKCAATDILQSAWIIWPVEIKNEITEDPNNALFTSAM